MPIRASALDMPMVQERFVESPAYKTAFEQLGYAKAFMVVDDFQAYNTAIQSAISKVVNDTSYDPELAIIEAAQLYEDEAN
jgi:maltose-binding protein MalE